VNNENIRNIALVGHSGTGKTSLAEAMLFTVAVTNRLGSVDEGNTISDYTEAEVSRKISISTSMLHCDWKNTKINILDTPGYADFIGDAKAAVWAVDSAVILVNAQNGVEIGTDKAFGFSSDYNRSCLFFINHMDKEFADFDGALEGIRDHFQQKGSVVVPFQIPVGSGEGFNQVVDVLQMKLVTYATDGSGKAEISDVPAELQEQAESIREQIVEGAAESEDELTEKYLEEEGLSDEDIARGLKIGIVNRTLFPVLCGAASKNIGSDLLMDFLVNQMPNPQEATLPTAQNGEEEVVELISSADGPLAAVVFKTISESVGDLSFLRVFSGVLKSGGDVFNASRRTNERIGQIYALNGQNRDDMEEVTAGDIGALIKLKDTHTGNTLCSKNNPLMITPVEFPHPLIRVALQPKSRGDEDKIGTGLQSIHEEDPSFSSRYEGELRQIIAEGQGELHLNVVFQKLKSKFGVEVEVVEPRIPYRETIRGKAEGHHRHKKQTGGRGQFGEAYLRIEPVQ